MNFMKLTKSERNWVLYDVGNSAFTLLVATIVPIYFNYLAGEAGLSDTDYLAYWGYAASIVTLVVMFIGPVFGTLADTKGFKMPIFATALLVGAVGCVCMGLPMSWFAFLVIFIIAKIGYSSSLVFYDSMISDVTTEDRVDAVSSQGYAWGYIGSCIPFLVCLVIVLARDAIGLSLTTAMLISFIITALWWVVLTVPMILGYHQTHYVEPKKHAVRDAFARIGRTFADAKKHKGVFLFLLAFFFYIDGVYTIIDMATTYGTALGFDTTGLLLALLLTQVIAFPCSILFGRLAAKYETAKLITVCIVAYLGIALFATFMFTQIQFWILAVLVGMFQGGIQALSRSYFTRLIPAEQAGEFFGLMDICGKGASLVGTTLVSVVTQLTDNMHLGVAMIAVLFVVGLVLFRVSVKYREK
ncbi:MAG: MFS transporter [Lachnospiraceae bacterium]|nr:MFS transporter [Lachnospiraceae bacterium]